jgi:hypothetical protein
MAAVNFVNFGWISVRTSALIYAAKSFINVTKSVIPAKAGTQSPGRRSLLPWVPAFAGMTEAHSG